MFSSLKFLLNSFTLTLGKFSVPIPYWQALALVVLIFILILTMADFRRHYVHWSLKGGLFGIFFGVLFTLILEGFLLIGGKTVLTETLGWKNAPAPLSHVLDAGRGQLIQVLGVESQIPSASAKENQTVEGAIQAVQSLNPADLKKVKSIICSP